MPGDYGYGEKQAAPMPGDYGNTSPPAYSNNMASGPAAVPMGVMAVSCKRCGTSFGIPEGAQSVSCPHCQSVHDQNGNVSINVTNNVNHYYGGGSPPMQQPQPYPVSPAAPVYPAPIIVKDGPLEGYAPDQQPGVGHCCDCGHFQGALCCCNAYLFFTLCRQSRNFADDGVCDSKIGHYCFYTWCYPMHVICDIIMAILSPVVFLTIFLWCTITYFCCCCEHKGGPLSTACWLTSRSLTTSAFVLCMACCVNA